MVFTFFFAYLSKADGSDHKVGQLFFILNRDTDTAVNFLFVLARWPILYAHNLNADKHMSNIYEYTYNTCPYIKSISKELLGKLAHRVQHVISLSRNGQINVHQTARCAWGEGVVVVAIKNCLLCCC